MQKRFILVCCAWGAACFLLHAQLTLPRPATNPKCMAGRQIGLTEISIRWGAPGVKGREGKIWGTDIAHYGFKVLGFGSNNPSPWRAGADENTTIRFSTDVIVNGKTLPAGEYGLHIALSADSSVLIFSKNTKAWGSYFYRPEWDALRVTARQQKDRTQSVEWLQYSFADQTDSSVVVALEWERWRIPFTVKVNLLETTLASVRAQMSSDLGFDPPSLEAAATWCLNKNVNLDEALAWINTATDPSLGGRKTFTVLSTKSKLLRKKGQTAEADKIMDAALENATVLELHGYGRQLIGEKKYKEALAIFERNHQRNGDIWPVHVGLARGYSANGDLKKALEHAKTALKQAPDDLNKSSLERMVQTLSEGKALAQ